jgi:Na+-translocating ferredoxin:NAD+ oxidoreductase subunit B
VVVVGAIQFALRLQPSSANHSGGRQELIQAIDQILPQTQCTRCGYAGCLPYANAIAHNQTLINRCPPGGTQVIERLAQLLNTDAIALDPQLGKHRPWQLAKVVEANCIGCTKCIAVCPVDAIIGSNQRMHTVDSFRCTGCELCLPVCPVDCIVMVEPPTTVGQWDQPKQARARQQHLRWVARNAGASARTDTNDLPNDPLLNKADAGDEQTLLWQRVEQARKKAKDKLAQSKPE